jgi:organic radical activating enzyme
MDWFNDGWALPLMEDFYTLQGEGFHTGKPAYFLRIGGCDVGCNFCDVKESWNKNVHPITPVKEIVQRTLSSGAHTAVVTGGEPCLYNLNVLSRMLKENNLQLHIETSGSQPLSGKWDWICFSPKKGSAVEPDFYEKASELKVIIQREDDFAWAQWNATQVRPECLLYLQPEWSRFKQITPSIVHYILAHPQWRISLQSHKFMHIP